MSAYGVIGVKGHLLTTSAQFDPLVEEMAGPSMSFIEELRVYAVYLSHADGEISLRGLDEDMVMIGHEAVGVADPIIALIDMLEGVQEVLPVGVGLKDRFRRSCKEFCVSDLIC